jgi:catalase
MSPSRRSRLLPPAMMTLCLLAAAPAVAQQVAPDQFVDALNGVFGKHPGARPVHAKGIVLQGTFTPSSTAASISKAPHLQTTPVPVTVRFSNFAGIPTLPDTDGLARPHGMAVKFRLPDGSETDIVAHSFNGFPVATAAEFHALLVALGSSGPNAPKPTPLDTFLAGHPIAKAFLTAPKPPPASYATLPYFGVNSFRFTNAAGAVTYGRYQFIPVAGTQFLAPEQAAKAGPDYLAQEIRDRLGRGPVEFRLMLQVADAGDRIDDPSVAWPDSRRRVDLGTIAITRAVEDNAAAERQLVFMPGALTPGIDAADPMIDVRSAVYAVSFGRRGS